MPTILIVSDIDGTLVDSRDAFSKLASGQIDRQEYAQEAAHAPAIQPVVDWLTTTSQALGADVRYLTGRAASTGTITMLSRIGAPHGPVHQADAPDIVRYKTNVVREWSRDYDHVFVLEDQPDIVAGLESLPRVTPFLIPGWRFGEEPGEINLPTSEELTAHIGPVPNPEGPGTVVLYSGGVDSYCLAVLENPDVLLHVNLHGTYGQVETDRLRTPPGMENRLVSLDLPLLSEFEIRDEGRILPARNAFLALLGAQYGDRVLMGSIAASPGSDKDEGFAERMTFLLKYVWQPQAKWNRDGRETRLDLPVYGLTKQQLVAKALEAGARGEDIRERTFSCYQPINGEPCGECGPCGKRWGALAGNGIEPDVDAREAFKPYWLEVIEGRADWRGEQHKKDVEKAWNSKW